MQAEAPGYEQTSNDLKEIADLIDQFCGYPRGHAERVSQLADALAEPFHLGADDRKYLKQAVMVRGAGILQMDRDYISARRVLTTSERIDLARHPVIAEQAAARLGLPRATQLIVRWQHEWWSGRGYPDGLAGEEIPLTSRILRVADSYSSMVSGRPFREALDAEPARKHLFDWAAIEFDPEVVRAFTYLRFS